jgi:hypothetical protein
MILSDAGGTFTYAFIVLLVIGVPAGAVVVNVASLQRRGLNIKCAVASLLFFVTLMIQGITGVLNHNDAVSAKLQLGIFAGTAAMNCLSAAIAVWGLWEVRRKHRWPRGKKRAIWTFWLNIFALAALGAFFFLRVNPKISERIFG